ncbi:MAG: hypothetical protein DRG39_05835 [Deltaproteobacteria bacterium]|nr:MAG: hypothetical protein DRG39_05835 [Deltaproteobacteria bacterium]
MADKIIKSIRDINKKIKQGKAVVLTAEEMVELVKKEGPKKAAREVDVVTTGTFSPMCSSGAFINFGHAKPPIKTHRVLLNSVPAYSGLAAVDIYIGATEPAEDDPLNKVHPGQFKYGGGHVIHDLIAGKRVELRAIAYGTDCYPRKELRKKISIREVTDAIMINPRNSCQNYSCAINLSNKTIYTYMGVLRPHGTNVNYATAGQLSPLLNDPYFFTIGIGTRIFLGGTQGYIVGPGTQYRFDVERADNGIPLEPAGTLMVTGNLKDMDPKWVVGVSIVGYGCSLAVGIGVPIPILNEEIAQYTGVSDEEIPTRIIDYGNDFPKGNPKNLGVVNYAELKSGSINFQGQEVQAVPVSSYKKAKEIAENLKEWINKGEFLLTEPAAPLPGASLLGID